MNKIERELRRSILQNNKTTLKDIAKRILKGKRKQSRIAFWPNAMAINALCILNPNDSTIRRQINLWKKKDFKIAKHDDVLMAYYLVSKKTLLSNDQIEQLIDNVSDSLKKYNDEPIPYRRTNEEEIYIDLLGMVPQMLIHLGIKRKNNQMIDWGILQFDEFINNALEKESGLPYHAYNKTTGQKLGIVGWGRAMGWIMTGLSNSINELNGFDNKKKKHLIEIYTQLLEQCKKYQRKDGGFSWQLQATDDHLDTSATGMILQSLLELKDEEEILKDNIEFARKMLKCLDANYEDGKVINCSAECGGAGIYPQKYGSYAWSVAPYVICKKLSEEIPEMR